EILRSIREKLMVLPDETTVYPGHGSKTTIGQERALY
ncbi:MAG: MBL fold metallo-hydrolase, partial [bacterium]